MGYTLTPHMDALAAFPSRGNTLRSLATQRRGRALSTEPILSPNSAALDWMREMSAGLTRIQEDVRGAREELAELRGARIRERLDGHSQRLDTHDKRLNDLEAAQSTARAVRRPWLAAAIEAGKLAAAALTGYAATVITRGDAP